MTARGRIKDFLSCSVSELTFHSLFCFGPTRLSQYVPVWMMAFTLWAGMCGWPLLRPASPEALLEWVSWGLKDRADVVCEIPQGKCAAMEGKGQGQRADLWHSQHNRQLWFPWQPAASLSRLSLAWDMTLCPGITDKMSLYSASKHRETPETTESGLESELGSDVVSPIFARWRWSSVLNDHSFFSHRHKRHSGSDQ